MARSILSNWVAMAITGVVSFIITPVLVHGLGNFYYGMWILVASVLDYYGVLDLGISTTVQRFVARYGGADQREGMNRTLATGLVLSGGISLCVAALAWPVAKLLPIFFGVTGPERTIFFRLVLMLGLAIAFTFPARVLGSYLCGLQRYDIYNLVSIVGAMVRAVLIVWALRMGYGVLGCGAVTLVVALVSLFLSWFLVRWADPRISMHWRYASPAQARELFSFSFYVFMGLIGDLLRTRLDSFVIARWLTLALVTPYNVAARLIEYFRNVTFSFMGPLMTSMSALEGQSKSQELRQLFIRSTRMAALLSASVACLLLVNGKPLLRHWVGQSFVSSFSILVVLTLGRVVAVGQTPSITILYAKGRNKVLGWLAVGEGVANLVLSIYWAKTIGLIGVALGTLVPLLVSKGIIQPWYTLHVAGVSARTYLEKSMARPVLVSGLFVAVSGLAGLIAGPNSTLLAFLWRLACQLPILALLAFAIGFTREDRQFFRTRAKGLRVMGRLVFTA